MERAVTRLGLLVAAVGLIATACSSSSGDDITASPDAGQLAAESAENVDAATVTDAVAAVDPASIDATAADLDPEQVQAALGAYLNYVALADLVRFGFGRAEAELTDVAAPAVVGEVVAWREANDAAVAAGAGVVGYVSAPGPDRVSGSADALLVHDCVAVEIEDALLGLVREDFVQHQATLQIVDGRWTVVSVDVTHSGDALDGPLGCVPDERRDGVDGVVRSFLGAIEAGWADPAGGAQTGQESMSEQLLLELEATLAQFVEAGQFVDASQEHEIEVLGSDAVLGGFLVASCTFFPEGTPARSIDTGEVLEDVPSPTAVGSHMYREWELRTLREDDGSSRDVVTGLRRQELDSDCDQG